MITAVFSVVMSRWLPTQSIKSYREVTIITSVRPLWECTKSDFWHSIKHDHTSTHSSQLTTPTHHIIILSISVENIIDGKYNVSKQFFKALAPYTFFFKRRYSFIRRACGFIISFFFHVTATCTCTVAKTAMYGKGYWRYSMAVLYYCGIWHTHKNCNCKNPNYHCHMCVRPSAVASKSG